MAIASLSLDRWPSIVSRLRQTIDLEASARRHKALLRRRGVRSAADLLHLALLYGPGGLSLRGVASFAAQAGLAELCDVSLLDRLRNAGDFLAEVLESLLSHSRRHKGAHGGTRNGIGDPRAQRRLALIDGSTVSVPGSRGSDWRLHARYEPVQGRFTALDLTKADTAEALCRLRIGPGDLLVQDRGYARLRNFLHARDQGSDFLCRVGWRSVRLSHPDGRRFDVVAALSDDAPPLAEHRVLIGASSDHPARLIIARKPPEATARQHQRLRRRAARHRHPTDRRTLQAAGFMLLLTSVDADQMPAQEALRLYHLRWQIELAFKRLKSLGGLADLPASDPRLARSWLLAHLIAAVLVEASISEALDSPP